jgi:hypothetical protein
MWRCTSTRSMARQLADSLSRTSKDPSVRSTRGRLVVDLGHLRRLYSAQAEGSVTKMLRKESHEVSGETPLRNGWGNHRRWPMADGRWWAAFSYE